MSMRYGRRGDGPAFGRLSALIFLTLCFGVGLAAGCCFASYLGSEAGGHLSSYLNGYFSLIREDEVVRASFFAVLWEVLRWPLAAGVLGLTAFGTLAVPGIFLIRGFLLSYTVSVFLLLFGSEGLPLALAVFGISSILSVTGLFVVGVDAFEWGKTLVSGPVRDMKERMPLRRHLICHGAAAAGWLAAGALIQYWLSPVLLRMAAGFAA